MSEIVAILLPFFFFIFFFSQRIAFDMFVLLFSQYSNIHFLASINLHLSEVRFSGI